MINDNTVGLSGIARVTELFREADRLEADAYLVFETDTTTVAIERYDSRKLLADRKYMQARIELALLKQQIDAEARLIVRHLYREE